MGIRTGEQYLNALKARKPDVWMSGQKSEDLVNEPVFSRPVREIAHLYDMQFSPQHSEQITHICQETGDRVSNAFLMPKSREDLRARRVLYETWARETFGLMGRSPDFLNVTLTSMASNKWFLEHLNPRWADNIVNYFKYVRDNDLFLTHAIINPQNDRSKPAHLQANPYMHLGAVEETAEGLLVRGAKMLATLAPVADEVIVYPFPGFQPGDEAYALAFAVPVDFPGLRIVCREPMQSGTRSLFDHPLASRFEEMDAVLIFNNVLVPWERVFMMGNVDAGNQFYPRTGLWQQPAHQTGVRGWIKLSFAMQVAARVADSIGVDGFLNVQTQLGELVQGVESVRALLHVAEEEFQLTEHGEARPAALPLETIRGLLPRLYPRAIEVLQTIGAGGLLLSPTEQDLLHPELGGEIEKYYGGRPGIAGHERVSLFKLAWDLCGEAFGQRVLQYERYYAGDPVRMLGMFYAKYKIQNDFSMVDKALSFVKDNPVLSTKSYV